MQEMSERLIDLASTRCIMQRSCNGHEHWAQCHLFWDDVQQLSLASSGVIVEVVLTSGRRNTSGLSSIIANRSTLAGGGELHWQSA